MYEKYGGICQLSEPPPLFFYILELTSRAKADQSLVMCVVLLSDKRRNLIMKHYSNHKTAAQARVSPTTRCIPEEYKTH